MSVREGFLFACICLFLSFFGCVEGGIANGVGFGIAILLKSRWDARVFSVEAWLDL